MAVLLEVDTSIGQTSTFAFGPEEQSGGPAVQANMTVLGTDHVFTLADLKAHYDAIGWYLHVPSLEQLRLGKRPDLSKLRERCETVVGLVEKVLSSQVWNMILGVTATLDQCANDDCKKPIHKRIPAGKDSVDARCFACKAEYSITLDKDGRALWEPKMKDAPCSTQGCPEKMALWPHEIRPGTTWRCRGCGAHNRITLSVSKVEDKDPVTG